jgi:plasmid stabilization system protein ParE
MIIRFSSDADAELAEARQWYAHQREDLDLEFMDSVNEALTQVICNPHLYPIVYRNLRRAVVRRFPFAIFFDVSEDEIQVIAVFHSRRDPEEWQSRVG